jgi:hypothetical protein
MRYRARFLDPGGGTILGSWPLEMVIPWGEPYLARLDEYPRKPKYPAM